MVTRNQATTTATEENNKNAMKLYMLIAMLLFLLMMGSLIIFVVSKRILSEEIGLLDKHFFGTVTITLWMPFYLFLGTLMIFGGMLQVSFRNKSNESTQKTKFSDALQELRRPADKNKKIVKIAFLILLTLAIVSLIGSQLYLYLGIVFVL